MQNWIRTGLLILALIGFVYIGNQSARADLSAYQANAEAYLLPARTGERIEQTFISAHADMKAVWLYSSIKPSSNMGSNSITLSLYSKNADTEKWIATQTIPLINAARQPKLEIQFPAQFASRDQQYHLVITTDAPEGSIYFYASREDRYPQGVLWVNGESQPADLAFQVKDAILPWNWFDDFGWFLRFFGQGLLLLLILALIGLAILVVIGKTGGADLSDWVPLAAVCGFGFIPIFYQLFSFLQQSVTGPLIWLSVLLLLSLAAVKMIILYRGKRPARETIWKQALAWGKGQGFSAILLGLFLLSFALRAAQARDLSAPSWTDGFSHLALVERILADQGIPQGLLYHTGYHTLVVFFHTLFGGEVPGQMLVIGQLINACVGLSFFTLARKILNDRWAALMAASLIWFLAPFPTYLFNWGRYPFLLGLVMLSPLITTCLSAWQEKKWIDYALAGYLFFGTVLCHYGMVSIWTSFLAIYMLIYARTVRRSANTAALPARIPQRGITALVIIFVVTAGALIYRFMPLLDGDKLMQIVTQSRQAAQAQDYRELVEIAFQSSGALFGIFCLYGVGLIWQMDRKILFLVVGWVSAYAALVALISPWLGEAIASYTNLITFAALPLALPGGAACAWLRNLAAEAIPAQPALQQRPNSRKRAKSPHAKWGAAMQTGIFFVLLIFGGGSSLLGQMNPATVFLTPADLRAMQWVRENTPMQSVFLINSKNWGGSDITPVDGGGWLEAVTARQVAAWDQQPPSNTNPISGFPHPWDYLYSGNGSGFIRGVDIQESGIPYNIVYQESGITIIENKKRK